MERPRIGDLASTPLVELCSSLQRAASALLRVEGNGDAVEDARRLVEQARSALEQLGHASDVPRVGPTADPATTRPYYFPGALAPRVHVAAPVMTAEQDGERRFGRVRFELIHEGPPGCVHGGFLAWMFDQAFGQHVVERDTGGGPTHRLEVTYRRPTPILTDLAYEVRTERVDGRKLFIEAELRHDDVVTAEARALFVQPRSGALALDRDDSDAR